MAKGRTETNVSKHKKANDDGIDYMCRAKEEEVPLAFRIAKIHQYRDSRIILRKSKQD